MNDTNSRAPQRSALSQRTVPVLAVGVFGGFVLGAVARGWMRLISDKPEFTWAGTAFIVLGFTVFGLAQSTVALARRHALPRRRLNVVRVIGIVCMLQLFFAAGAIMFPTVFGAGLAVARRGWHSAVRMACLVIAAGPVLFVGSDLVHKFGMSIQTAVGFTSMLALYSVIIWATRFALAPQAEVVSPDLRC
jgi:hypothetical protein